MSDYAIDAILSYPDQVSFRWLRSRFMADGGLKGSLNFGHAVLDTTAKLDQYLYTYGPMIESQWHEAFSHIGDIGQPSMLIDYGCGQGLAGLLLGELTHGIVFQNALDIILIEPSADALARAVAIYGRLAPAATITCVGKRFEMLANDDVPSKRVDQTLHIFSNSLDIPGFDALDLLAKTVNSGRHTLLSVSHDREFNGGTPQIESVRAAVEGLATGTGLTIHRTVFERFTCNNPSQSKGVVWLCEFEVNDG